MKKFKITFNSPVVLGFTLLCFLVMMIGIISGGQSTLSYFMTYRAPLSSPMTYVRMITHIFGHADWNHFMGNVTYILLLGPLLEEKYGSGRLVQVIALTAIVTALVNAVLFPTTALCGASGVCFAFILLSSITCLKEKEIPLTFILVCIIFIGQQIMDGVFVADHISNTAHIVGGIVGSVFGFMFSKKKKSYSGY